MTTYFRSIVILLCALSSMFHLTGSYILICLRHSTMNGSQRLFLLHLSLSELYMTAVELIKQLYYVAMNSNGFILDYINVVQMSSGAMVYYFIMIYMTIDRFLAIYLNMRYKMYWSGSKTRCLLKVTWVIFFMLAMVTCLLHKYQLINYRELFYMYIWPATDAVFLVVALGTYGYIIQRVYKRNKFTSYFKTSSKISDITKNATTGSQQNQNTTTGSEKNQSFFMKPTFYVPMVLILTFSLLIVAPDLALAFVILSGKTVSEDILSGVFMAYMVSTLLHIFLSPHVRRMLMKKLISIKHTCRKNNLVSHTKVHTINRL